MERLQQRIHAALSSSGEVVRQPGRTPEAHADIAAARAAPMEVQGCPTPGCGFQAGHMDRHPCGIPADVAIAAEDAALDAALSNAALADTPAVREMGGRIDVTGDGREAAIRRELEVKRTSNGCKACDCLGWEIDNGKAIILRGIYAEQYRALQAAARAAQQTAQAHQTASIALRDTIQQVCAGLAPGKEG